jgi:X-Pro dipeptidyl-peptidase
MLRKGLSRGLAAILAIAVLAALSAAGVGTASHASADATTTACTPDPPLDALDPCRADTGSPSDDDADYSYSTAIVSHVEVPVPVTTVDAINPPPGGEPSADYIWVDYIRPAISNSVKVPTIMDESPYYNTLGRGYDSILKSPTDPNAPEPVSVERCSSCPEAAFPEWEAHYFVPRGYAVALMDIRGTRNSSGCEVYGDKQEGLDAVAVIDWIASQSWSNQRVGMIGGSYDGTMANAAAALYPIYGQYHNVDGHGMDALAAVVPVRAIDRWYDYQFFNGVEANGQELDPELFTAELPSEDNPTNGDPTDLSDPTYAENLAQRHACPGIAQISTDAGYTAPYQDTEDASTTNFWNSRDFLQYTPTWKAATLFIHGLFDNNVKTFNSGQLWDALSTRANPPPLRYLWFNGAHADPDTPSVAVENANGLTSEYLMPYTWMQKFEQEVHQWFLQFLKGVNDGALTAPKVEIQRDYDDPGDSLQQGHWDSYDQYPADPSYADDTLLHLTPAGGATPSAASAGSVQWDDSGGASIAPASQSFVTAPFTTDTRISGQLEFDLDISTVGTDTTIAVEVDDVPPGASNDPNFASEDVSTNTDPFAITYGYIRAYYRASVNPRGASYPSSGSFLTPNTQYTMSFPSAFTDYIVRAGHQLRFTFSDASQYSIATDQGYEVTMYTGATGGLSQVRVPEVAYTPTPPPASVPEFSVGLLGVGGPVTGVLLAGVVAWEVRRRRRA